MAKAKQKFSLEEIKQRVHEFLSHNAEAVEKGWFIRVTASIFAEMAWLIEQVEEHADAETLEVG